MSIEPFLIASTVRAVVGQRLVRRLCPNFRESYTPDAAIIKQIMQAFNINDSAYMKKIHDMEAKALAEGIGKTTMASTNPKSTASLSTSDTKILKLWKAGENGCDECGHNGYRGRMGIYEALENSTEIQKMIVSNATSEVIQTQAIKEGMITMQIDGLIKALRGQTSIEEILRVTSEE
jgi:type IV pilus assembly protein PilB